MSDWVSWALANNLPTELIFFIRYRPDLLFDFKPTNEITNSPCPRTVHNVGKLMKMGVPKELEYELFTGAAGEGFAAEFVGFLTVAGSLKCGRRKHITVRIPGRRRYHMASLFGKNWQVQCIGTWC